ncbi:MAG: flagellar hook-length control protein FliK [Pseudomonadales bacterium]|nr:flagellar hook-length control protein FliK [Pseudomonadales bacterium]
MQPGTLFDLGTPRAPVAARDALPPRGEAPRPGDRPETDDAVRTPEPDRRSTPRDDAAAGAAEGPREGPPRERSDGGEAFGQTFDAALAELVGPPTPIAAAVADVARAAATNPVAETARSAGATAAAVLDATGTERLGSAAALAALASRAGERLANGEIAAGTERERALAVALAERLEAGGGERTTPESVAEARNPAFAQLLAARGVEAAAPREAPAFETPLAPRQPNFDTAVAERVRWLAERGSESAELRLDPPQLGSLGVRVRVEGDQASLLFTSSQAAVREALEAAIPRLRELFAEAGLQLGDVDVGSGDASADGGTDRFAAAERTASADGAPEPGSALPGRRGGRGLLDAYA